MLGGLAGLFAGEPAPTGSSQARILRLPCGPPQDYHRPEGLGHACGSGFTREQVQLARAELSAPARVTRRATRLPSTISAASEYSAASVDPV